jgi:fumarate reductase flavoprotein subunit
MLKIALGIAMGALQRTESRGAHSREDYPERNDQDWLKRTLFSWPDENAEQPTIDYEVLDVSTMEPPLVPVAMALTTSCIIQKLPRLKTK